MKKRILIVDDEIRILDLFSQFLEKENLEIHTALSGKQALGMMDKTAYDLILLDLKMPGMDGTETLREIRGKDPKVFVYIVTAFADEFFDELKVLEEQDIPFEVLNKPVEKEQFLVAVNSALGGPLRA